MFGDESLELKLEDVKLSDLGEVGEVVITKDDTLLMRGRVNLYLIEQPSTLLSLSCL